MRWRHCVVACACVEAVSTWSGVGRRAESFGRCRVVRIAEQLHPQLGLFERLLAAAVQADAALVGGERLLEAQLAVQIGRAHVGTPVTHAQPVCRLLLEKKQKKQKYRTQTL